MDLQDDIDYFSFLSPYPWMEPSQYHWDWSISDPPAVAAESPSHTHLPQAAEIHRDQEMADPSHNITDIDHTPVVDVDIEPNAGESSSSQQPTRKQSNDLVKRRARKSKKSDRIDEIRDIVGLGRRASKLEVLNAAIQHLGGAVPQSASTNKGERMKLAYEALHERTGSQGRLKHVQCLELVIQALKGRPTLNPIFVGQPNLRTPECSIIELIMELAFASPPPSSTSSDGSLISSTGERSQ